MIAAGIAALLSVIGLAQAVAGWLVLRKFMRNMRRPELRHLPTITVLKPLHGDEPLLEQALASVCAQDYPAPWQVVFGFSRTNDSALPVVRRLQSRFPEGDLAVVVDQTVHGPNRKVSNLINMLPAAKHDVLVIADSDIHVARDWLRRLAGALARPEVGLVTAIYTGLPASSVATLGALQINHYFLLGALLARCMGRQDCLGATMALTRETLARIGGFPSLVNHLADDNVGGDLVQRLGLKVSAGTDTVPSTSGATRATLGALCAARIALGPYDPVALEPAQFAASVLQYPIAWGAVTVLLAGFGADMVCSHGPPLSLGLAGGWVALANPTGS